MLHDHKPGALACHADSFLGSSQTASSEIARSPLLNTCLGQTLTDQIKLQDIHLRFVQKFVHFCDRKMLKAVHFVATLSLDQNQKCQLEEQVRCFYQRISGPVCY